MDGYFTAKVKYNVTSVQAFVEKLQKDKLQTQC
jgi:hypothetical protein